jgi:hypothetical protein
MTFKVGGTEVGFYSTAESHVDFYGLVSGGDVDPQAQGLKDAGVFDTNGGVHACRIGLHENTNDGTYAMFIHNGEVTDGSEKGQAKTICEDLETKLQQAGYVFDAGQGVQVGSAGDTDYVFVSGEQLTNEGTSPLVFESGVGVNYENVSTLVEDDEEDPNTTGDFADSYDTTGTDAIAQHGYSRSPSDGVVWPLTVGSYEFTLRMERVDDGRDLSLSEYPLPEYFYGVGPSSFTDAGSAGEGATVQIDVDL